MNIKDWSFFKEITIDSTKVAAQLSNWPLLIHLNEDSDLAASAQPSGDDILFSLQDGTQLSHEIEFYDSSNGTLWAHVKMPSVAADSDTSIYMYYGNDSADNQESVEDVWSNGYEAVYHLGESKQRTGNTGVYKDSAGSLDGTDFVSDGINEGKIGRGQEFDGTDDYIKSDGDLPISADPDVTMSAWINADLYDGEFRSFMGNNSTSVQNEGLSFTVKGSKPALDFWSERYITDSRELTQDTWHHVVGTKPNGDISNTSIYVDGSERPASYEGGSDGPPDVGKAPAIIGRLDDGRNFNGLIDEARYASVERSSAWIETTYINQDDPLSFYSVSPEELVFNEVSSAAESGSVRATPSNVSVQMQHTGISGSAQQSVGEPKIETVAPVNGTSAETSVTVVRSDSLIGIGGTVTFADGRTVGGAIVRIIESNKNEVVEETTTDTNGKWSVSVPGGSEPNPEIYTIDVRYSDGDVRKTDTSFYNAENRPFLDTARLSPRTDSHYADN